MIGGHHAHFVLSQEVYFHQRVCYVFSFNLIRVFIRGGEGGGRLEFPSYRNLEIEYGYYCGAINISYYMLLDINKK